MKAFNIVLPSPLCIDQSVSSVIFSPYPSHPIRIYPFFMQSLRTGLSPVPLNDTFHTIASSDIFTSFFADNGRSASVHNLLNMPDSILYVT